MTIASKPRCKLVGTDGNVFAVIGAVAAALTRAGLRERASAWRSAALQCHSYDEVLQLAFQYVDVE